MNSIEKNPYQPPESQTHEPAAAQEFIPSPGRRVTSTIICTGGMIWCLMSLAVFLQTALSTLDGEGNAQRGDLLVLVFLGVIGVAIFLLGLCIRRNQKLRTFLMMLVILALLVMFPFIAIATDDSPNPFR